MFGYLAIDKKKVSTGVCKLLEDDFKFFKFFQTKKVYEKLRALNRGILITTLIGLLSKLVKVQIHMLLKEHAYELA